MAELPTNFRFDAIYIVAANSEAETLSAGDGSYYYPEFLELGGVASGMCLVAGGIEGGLYSQITNEPSAMFAAQDLVASNSHFVTGSWGSDLSADYQALGTTLAELHSSTDEDWKVDEPVYNVARYVASELMAGSYPAPRLLLHGSDSVVFFWQEGPNNLYLTVSEDQLSALVTADEEIQFRCDFPQSILPGASVIISAIESARVGRPVISGTEWRGAKSEAAE